MTKLSTPSSSATLAGYLADLLVELCAVDTSPQADVAVAAMRENQCFAILERELAAIGLPARLCRVPIRPEIAEHRFFSIPYYANSGKPIDVRACYRDRSNLLVELGEGEGGVAINVHIDVVAPYFPPRVEGGIVHGRGACDDKGNVAALVGALRLLGDRMRREGLRLDRPVTAMFVIDEETGGNGSLSLALDEQLARRYASLLVLECTDMRLHPGNRGCVWYKVEGHAEGVNLFEAAAFIIEELEREGRAIRDESDHPLFPHRPVQTCHGIIGKSGEHPSRINGGVSFRILAAGSPSDAAERLIRDALDEGLREYIDAYGDKSRELRENGTPKVPWHYRLQAEPDGWTVQVLGSTGHMGSILENDGAITKMAAMVRALLRRQPSIESAVGRRFWLGLDGWADCSYLLLEGGQGFLPTHRLEDIERRLREAVARGARRYAELAGIQADLAGALDVSFNKLHNAAFAGDPDGPAVRDALASCAAVGLSQPLPLRGWDVSCDARLFACTRAGLPVLTMGAGALRHAHADDEQVRIADLMKMAEFLADFIVRQTGAK
jgi:acetylornithine deacetylase/succinyl-diaminopimelate desuccinylase-like protein